ncbi:MAG: 2OG-Fe(II) oxygenase [Pseudomonadota bacterium]
MQLDKIIDLSKYPISDPAFQKISADRLETNGVLTLPNFFTSQAFETIKAEAQACKDHAYFCTQTHSVYLTEPNPNFPKDHAANRHVTSSKGCICDDVVPMNSPLRALYKSDGFKTFITSITGAPAVHPYADPLSSINIHYANKGQELGWHFDNSSFAITILIQKPDAGGAFEYIKDLRNADAGDMNYEGVTALLDGATKPAHLEIEEGTFVLFRGRNSIHRVSPNESDKTRMLAVLAYNSKPGVALSENARMTFYGRLN